MDAVTTKQSLDNILDQLRFYKIRITFEAIEPVYLAEYKGSVFRGCMGEAFRREVCCFPGKKCEECNLQYECEFALMYETPLKPTHHLYGRYTHPPRPYIIIPMSGKNTVIDTGNEFYFDLFLIGSAIELLPTLITVFDTMGEIGIGTKLSKFKVVHKEQFIPTQGFQMLNMGEKPVGITFNQLSFTSVGSSLSLEFQHPVRFLKANKPYKDPPPFTMLISNLARRMSLLAHIYCSAEWVNTDRIFNLDESVTIKSHQLEWKDWTRYSGTKEKNLYFDGNLGMITYQGDIAPWAKLLQIGTWLHTGSTATFGLGKYRIIPDE